MQESQNQMGNSPHPAFGHPLPIRWGEGSGEGPRSILCAALWPSGSLLPVNVAGRLELRFGDFEACTFAFDRAEETRLVSFVTRRADLFDLNQQRVAVTIERDVLDLLRVTTAFALHPEPLTGATPEMGLARRQRRFE